MQCPHPQSPALGGTWLRLCQAAVTNKPQLVSSGLARGECWPRTPEWGQSTLGLYKMFCFSSVNANSHDLHRCEALINLLCKLYYHVICNILIMMPDNIVCISIQGNSRTVCLKNLFASNIYNKINSKIQRGQKHLIILHPRKF